MQHNKQMQMAVKAITEAVQSGQVDRNEARTLRRKLGIPKSYFTKKTPTAEQRKARREIQKQSRKVNQIKNTQKGQKQSGRK